MQLTISAVSDKGCVREHNEDMVLIGSNIFRDEEMSTAVDILGKDGKFFVAVTDGIGGHNAGEIASRIILQEMAERIDTLEAGLNEKELSDRFARWAKEIHSYILEEGNKNAEMKGMGATLIGVLFYNDTGYYINAGDSRLYRLRGGYLTQISEDHSLRKLTGDDTVPSNIILNSFGGGDKIFIDFALVGKRLIDEDILLLCSDGLTDMLTDEEIEGVLNTPEDAVSRLLTKAKNRGGKDNISIVTVKIKE